MLACYILLVIPSNFLKIQVHNAKRFYHFKYCALSLSLLSILPLLFSLSISPTNFNLNFQTLIANHRWYKFHLSFLHPSLLSFSRSFLPSSPPLPSSPHQPLPVSRNFLLISVDFLFKRLCTLASMLITG